MTTAYKHRVTESQKYVQEIRKDTKRKHSGIDMYVWSENPVTLIKKCSKCKTYKDALNFQRHSDPKRGCGLKLRSRCKSCLRQTHREWYSDHREQRIEYMVKNKDTRKDQRKEYVKRNRGKINSYNAANQRKLVARRPKWANKSKIRKVYDKAHILRKNYWDVQVDHIVPINSDIVCGLHCESNLQITLTEYNARKKNYWWPDHPSDNMSSALIWR